MYFTADGTTPLVLSGPHTWSSLQNIDGIQGSFSFQDYLDDLVARGHNCIRLWTWPGAINAGQAEQFPHPWPRDASQSEKFLVRRFDGQFFSRLRNRVRRAGEQGIYVIVMFCQQLCSRTEGLDYLPSMKRNNVNGVNDELMKTDAQGGKMSPFQIAYAKKFVEALSDFDNVLWEIGNEVRIEYDAWQKDFVGKLRAFEAQTQSKKHLIGVNTGYGSGSAGMQKLLDTGADYIGLISKDCKRYVPPAWTWGRPVLADSDHLREPLHTRDGGRKVDWAWFSFVRGYHPIDMQAIQVPLPGYPNQPWNDLGNPSFQPALEAMTAVLEVAGFAPLERMAPQKSIWDGEASAEHSDSVSDSLDLHGPEDPEEDCTPDTTKRYFVLSDTSADDPFYVGYSQGIDIVLDLSGISGTLWWQTYDPRTGTPTSGPMKVQGGNRREVFSGPGGRWVLVLSSDQDPTWRAR